MKFCPQFSDYVNDLDWNIKDKRIRKYTMKCAK